eukprot:1161079-Pelagomonas_calceolata.AAC.2
MLGKPTQVALVISTSLLYRACWGCRQGIWTSERKHFDTLVHSPWLAEETLSAMLSSFHSCAALLLANAWYDARSLVHKHTPAAVAHSLRTKYSPDLQLSTSKNIPKHDAHSS